LEFLLEGKDVSVSPEDIGVMKGKEEPPQRSLKVTWCSSPLADGQGLKQLDQVPVAESVFLQGLEDPSCTTEERLRGPCLFHHLTKP
jgi:hypothetical protein